MSRHSPKPLRPAVRRTAAERASRKPPVPPPSETRRTLLVVEGPTLSADELLAVLEDRRWSADARARTKVEALLAAWLAK